MSVIGVLAPFDISGRPTTQYSIDGEITAMYTAPFVPSSDVRRYNVTFFSVRDLVMGNHTIEIENMNGTSPNTFSLDYFLFYGPFLGSPTSVAINPELPTMSITATPSDVSSTNTPRAKRMNPGAIAGSAVAGGTILAFLVLAFFCFRRRRRPHVGQGTHYVSRTAHYPNR